MDSIIPLGQKNTLAKYMILFSADNHPPMFDKDPYDSWKSIMELYMQNRKHRRMILKSIENGPLIWPTIEENGMTRTKKYAELSAAEKIQANCDMKATNIIFQAVLMANISNYVSDVILKVPHFETYLNDMENQTVHTMQDFEQTPVVDVTNNRITNDINIILYSQYLQETQQEQVDILRGIVKQAKAKQPLDNALDFFCKHAQRIQELLVYVRDTCPNSIKLSVKKVEASPKNIVKKVRFAEPLIPPSNVKQRAFATVINKCLSGKETGMDKIHLSRAQIL
nr:hypothetical protein [Tanacetum cinerariifolium]